MGQTAEEKKERRRLYIEKNKEKIKEKEKQYREKNKEKIKERQKQYREKNKEKIKEKQKQYYEKNKEKEYIKEQDIKTDLEKLNEIEEYYMDVLFKNPIIYTFFDNIYREFPDYESKVAFIKAREQEIIECDCGGRYKRKNKSNHRKTNKHQEYLKSQL